MTIKKENDMLISLGSLSNAEQHIKRLLGTGGNLHEDPDLEGTSLVSLANGLVENSPADVENIFSIELNLFDKEQVKEQECFVKEHLEELSENEANLPNSYIWVELSSEYKVVVVGKSDGSDDLFRKYANPAGKTVEALITHFCSLEDQDTILRCFDRINQEIIGAVIVPIRIDQKFKDLGLYLRKVETLIGEQIVRAYGAINPKSHTH